MERTRSTEEAVRVIERFQALPIEGRLEIYRNLSAEAREELIGTISSPGEIVRRISEEEIFFTIKQLGEENALNLVAATTGKQLQYLLDIDLWRRDMFDTRAAYRWINLIAGISGDKILHFVQVTDPELFALALDRLIKVYTRDPDFDLLEQMDHLPQFTLDDQYFVEFRVPDAENAVRIFLETIFLWDVRYYSSLMQELLRGISLENEEMALKWRRARLADHGFPEFDEALEIYSYLPVSHVCRSGQDQAPVYEEASTELMPVLEYPLKLLDSETLFLRCIRRLDDMSFRDRLSTELAHLANKVVIADGREPGSVEQIQGALNKVGGHINMALEAVCNDDVTQAMALLQSNHMDILFRRGFSLVLDLRKQAQKLVTRNEGGMENLGYPLAELLRGLMQKRPFYAATVVGEKTSREFQHLEDLHIIRQYMEKALAEENWEPI